MELMSLLRLLLCALAAPLPGALGVSMARFSEIKLSNNSLMVNQKPPTHKILLNINGPPLVKVVTELQSVFRDIACRNCTTCMERAIRAYKVHSHIISYQPNAQELYYNVLSNTERRKRNTAVSNNLESKTEESNSVMATVTKYTRDRKVYALKVTGMIENDVANCKVYSVKKSVPCDSGSDIITAKKSTNKKSKRIKVKTPVTTTTETVKLITSVYKKREVDNSQVSESFLPSIEEMY